MGRSVALQLALALTLGLSTGCADDTLVGGESALASDRAMIDFGRVFIGQRRTETFTLSAPGQLPLQFAARFEGIGSGLSAGPQNGRLGGNASIVVQVFFAPETPGARRATLIFDSDATRSATVAVQIRGTAVVPPDCEDGNGCTVDTFDLETGQCVHRAERLACDDFNACTASDTCLEGVCLGEARSCDDGDVCTDDFCDPRMGCVNVATSSCDDGNPCTMDVCRPEGGCENPVLEDGTPCDDLQQCTIADICLAGSCIGVAVDDGIACDDGDPCSKNDACAAGECIDLTYVPPGFGDVKFATPVEALGRDAPSNVILDRDDNMFVATSSGVVAIDLCGEVVWENAALGEPRFAGAVSLPGLLTLPIGDRLVDVDTATGAVVRKILFEDLFEPVQTSSTTRVRIVVEDAAVRSSGGLVVSVRRTIEGPGRFELEGQIAEVDATRNVATTYRRLGARWASRIAVDQDEAVVAILQRGRPGEPVQDAQIVRFGVGSVPGDTWSSSEVPAARTDLAIGESNEVLWSAGLVSIAKNGTPLPFLPAPLDPAGIHAGAPVAAGDLVHVVLRRDDPNMPSFAPGGTYHLVTLTASSGEALHEISFMDPVVGMSPVVDLFGNVFVLTSAGTLFGFSPTGGFLFDTQLPIDTSRRLDDVALGITSRGAIVGTGGGHAFGVQSSSSMSGAAWPRRKRDNLASGHR